MIIINGRIGKLDGQVTELIYSQNNQARATKVNTVSNKRISSNRTVNKLLPFEVTDKKNEEVCGPSTECRGSGM